MKRMVNQASILNMIQSNAQIKKPLIALLLDPDKTPEVGLHDVLSFAFDRGVQLIFTGSSQPMETDMHQFIRCIKTTSPLPVVLFPGHYNQLSKEADALLYLSLISGRNPEFLIGQHVSSVSYLLKATLEIIPTGYILVDGGKTTSVQLASNTTALDRNSETVIRDTAKAGEWLGMKLIYLEAGSGAEISVPQAVISAVRSVIDVPLIVGGGIDTADKAVAAVSAGADVIVIGNGFEKNPDLLTELSQSPYFSGKKTSQFR